MQENTIENVFCKLAAILSWPQCAILTPALMSSPGGEMSLSSWWMTWDNNALSGPQQRDATRSTSMPLIIGHLCTLVIMSIMVPQITGSLTGLFNDVFRLTTTTKKLKPPITVPLWGESITDGFPSQRASNVESIPMSRHHHGRTNPINENRAQSLSNSNTLINFPEIVITNKLDTKTTEGGK